MAVVGIHHVLVETHNFGKSAKFWQELGWRLDADFSFDDGFRVVQFTPPGSAMSVQFGTKMTAAPPRLKFAGL